MGGKHYAQVGSDYISLPTIRRLDLLGSQIPTDSISSILVLAEACDCWAAETVKHRLESTYLTFVLTMCSISFSLLMC